MTDLTLPLSSIPYTLRIAAFLTAFTLAIRGPRGGRMAQVWVEDEKELEAFREAVVRACDEVLERKDRKMDRTGMTPDQKDLFIQAAQLGLACGLEHPFEWYANAERAMGMEYSKVDQYVADLQAAFVTFYRDTGSAPNDPVESWTEKDFIQAVNGFYEKPSKASEGGEEARAAIAHFRQERERIEQERDRYRLVLEGIAVRYTCPAADEAREALGLACEPPADPEPTEGEPGEVWRSETVEKWKAGREKTEEVRG
jgi:hypothetical protein